MKFAAIDIGSNAARLLIVDVTEPTKGKTEYNKLNLIRIPLRLGIDVFSKGKIGRVREKMIMESMQAFQHTMAAYGVKKYRACATSAMRDAQNSKEIIAEVKRIANINIEIISGDEEASLVFENHFTDHLDPTKSYLYIDVGGGSTELSFFSKGIQAYRESFNIGTIRLLQGLVKPDDWTKMETAIKNRVEKVKTEIIGIGSGGNINKVFSMSKKKEGETLSSGLLRSYLKEFEKLSVLERMEKYSFKEDRADVIVPALQIYTSVVRWAGIKDLYVPKIGLADGLIHKMHQQYKRKTAIR